MSPELVSPELEAKVIKMNREIFKPGHRYEVKANCTSGVYQFHSGEILTFDGEKYSPYDSSFAYEFHDSSGSAKTWWLHQDAPSDAWNQYFQPVGVFG